MLARIYHNPQNKEENQSRLQKILQFWASKEVYDHDTIRVLENEMMGGLSTNSFSGLPQRDLSVISADPSTFAGNYCVCSALSFSLPALKLSKKKKKSLVGYIKVPKLQIFVIVRAVVLVTRIYLPNLRNCENLLC